MQQTSGTVAEITESVMRDAITGMKEAEGSATSVLNSLFSPPSKKRTKELGMNEQDDVDQMNRFVDRLSRLIDMSGNQEKVALGKNSRLFVPDTICDVEVRVF